MFEIGDILIDQVVRSDSVTVVFKTASSYTIENNVNKLRDTFGKNFVEKAYRKEGSVVILKPDEPWVPYASTRVEADCSCTCGVTSIGAGLHSDWCDLHEKVS